MKKVLLINDSKLENLIMKDTLKTFGYDVMVADEYTALDQISKYQPHYAIVNLIMKETNGNVMAKKIKKIDSTVRCIISSSSDIKKDEFDARIIDDVIKTPVEGYALNGILNNLEN